MGFGGKNTFRIKMLHHFDLYLYVFHWPVAREVAAGLARVTAAGDAHLTG